MGIEKNGWLHAPASTERVRNGSILTGHHAPLLTAPYFRYYLERERLDCFSMTPRSSSSSWWWERKKKKRTRDREEGRLYMNYCSIVTCQHTQKRSAGRSAGSRRYRRYSEMRWECHRPLWRRESVDGAASIHQAVERQKMACRQALGSTLLRHNGSVIPIQQEQPFYMEIVVVITNSVVMDRPSCVFALAGRLWKKEKPIAAPSDVGKQSLLV